MFDINQIVFDVTLQKPVKAYEGFGTRRLRQTHFISAVPAGRLGERTEYPIFLPKSKEHAEEMMRLGVIFPAPLPSSHCPLCFNWKSNHHLNGECWEFKPFNSGDKS